MRLLQAAASFQSGQACTIDRGLMTDAARLLLLLCCCVRVRGTSGGAKKIF